MSDLISREDAIEAIQTASQKLHGIKPLAEREG